MPKKSSKLPKAKTGKQKLVTHALSDAMASMAYLESLINRQTENRAGKRVHLRTEIICFNGLVSFHLLDDLGNVVHAAQADSFSEAIDALLFDTALPG